MPRAATSLTGPSVHIVVTCTNRKSVAVPARLRLGDVREHRQDRRFVAWTQRLSADKPSIRAADLYGGEHWQVARKLPVSFGESARLWVCSAGYGLIAADTHLNPYAATFSPGNPDSVGETTNQVRAWWLRLTDWAGPVTGQPRSFADLARRDPGAAIVAVLSEAYVRACSDDLREAADTVTNRDRFAVVGPAGRGDDLDDVLVPVTARLRAVTGGSLQALHVRVAAHLLSATSAYTSGISRSRLRETVQQIAATAPADPSRRNRGARLSDAEVQDFIRFELAAGPASATVLLRRLRQSGRSCEQSRFKQLFIDTMAEEVPG